MEVSLKAGELVEKIYAALLKQYRNPEDAGIFGRHGMFHDYLQNHEREARHALYPGCSLADLYNLYKGRAAPRFLRAHQQNDRAVMEAYGFSVRDMTESTCVAELMKLYQKLTERKP